jgi:omega-hydroxy-beta-dihydromenaquinone-9 sulfotransferase
MSAVVDTDVSSPIPAAHDYRRFARRVRLLRRVLWKRRQYLLWAVAALAGPLYPRTTRFFFRLDEILYPGLADVSVEQAIFIMGHPRSGTTYLQQLIGMTDAFAMFKTWQIVFPSIVQRKIARPFVSLLRHLRVDTVQPATRGHEVRLDGIEEEEGLFAHLLESDLVTYAVPWLLLEDDYREGLNLGRCDESTDAATMVFFRECIRRHVYVTKNPRVVVKANPMVFRLRMLSTVFPDARIVYLVRSPVQAVGSYFSMIENFVGHLLSPEQSQLFFRQRYRWSVELYRYFEEAKTVIPEERRIAIPFFELTKDTKSSLRRFFNLAEYTPDPAYWEDLNRIIARPHTRKHGRQPLRRFGLTRERIAFDLGFVFRRYLNGV